MHHHYPSFASFYSHRAEPAFELLLDDPEARELVLGDIDAATLKHAIRAVADNARNVSFGEGRWPWEPESEKLTEYLETDPEEEPNA